MIIETLGDMMHAQGVPESNALIGHITHCFGHDLTIDEINKPNLKHFSNYLKAAVCNNSAKTYMAVVKSTINIYKYDFDQLRKFDMSGLNIKKEGTIMAYLGESDLDAINAGIGKMAGEELYYALIMLCQAYVGCRVSDIQKIKPTSIEHGILRYVSEKTGIRTEVPVKKGLLDWVRKINELNEIYTFSEPKYNSFIKHICFMSGITQRTTVYKSGRECTGPKWRYISSHSLRRSFATNLYLRGADIYSISKMMGHTSVDMTRNYICCGLREMNDIIMAFFD